MEVLVNKWRRLELNGGQVRQDESGLLHLELQPVTEGYAVAKSVDDRGEARNRWCWGLGKTRELSARFSHQPGKLGGTAGFGYWNASFGPGTGPLPALPRAVWIFYPSPPGDLPMAPAG